jgi:hypothetical protein
MASELGWMSPGPNYPGFASKTPECAFTVQYMSSVEHLTPRSAYAIL